MPRFLARLPYGAKTNPVEEFNFEEETAGGEHGAYTWANSAYAMAVNINNSFKMYGWCSCIRGVESGRRRRRPADAHLPHGRGRRRDEVPDRDRDQRPARGRTRQERLHAAGAPQELRLRAFIGAQSLQKPSSTTTRTPPPTPTWRRGCPTCSPAAASRTT
jgi:type VI secretion system protein ImpC